jgi:death-on-curing protein
MTKYLTMAEALFIHAAQISAQGGAPGARDLGLVEAALLRPQTGYYSDLIEEAAALWESLTMNHGFVDGHKKVALACTEVFLDINGLVISANNHALLAFICENLEGGTFTKDVLDAWLRANTAPA